MRYIVAGDGSMPLKEIGDVPKDLAVSDADELFYVLGAKTKFKVGESLLGSGAFGKVIVAVLDEALAAELSPDLAKGADDIVLFDPEEDLTGEYVVLALLPGPDDPDDTFLEDLVQTALDDGQRCLAMNEQLYDLAVEPGEDAPVEAEPEAAAEEAPDEPNEPGDPVGIPTVAEMEALTRNDLKALAKSVGAKPADWRQKDAIINGILATQVDQGEPFGEPKVDLDALAAEVAEIPDEATDNVTELPVQRPITFSSPALTAPDPDIQIEILDTLLADIIVAIQKCRAELRSS